ncbi:MAG: DUF3631 domain-containing protein [Chloroflexi bacterium]|nr:MAG: DUF3631 domain-containing protein [Chloroflexota bacterium]
MSPVRPLTKLQQTIARYVVCTEEQRLVIALWIIHAHLVEHLDQTPYLLVTSPRPRCGKSTLVELIEFLVPRPFNEVLPSEAVVYRVIQAAMPTLLLDEIDAVFNPRTAKNHEGLRALLNAGNRKGATVPRCVGPRHEIHEFSVFSAKLIAAIGTLPDTIADRSIPIRLQRKKRSEPTEKFRRREVGAVTGPIRDGVAAWAAEHGEEIGLDRPDLPEELNDRAQDACEPLIAIADHLGYGDEARAALVSLLSGDRVDSTDVAQLNMLRDIRTLFHSAPNTVAFTTEQLLLQLRMGDWSDYYGRSLDARDLAALLRPFEIESRTVRSGEITAKGYHRDSFHDAWERYLADDAVEDEELVLA